jgi:pSer/pThr/pTyr-binding forkhead associated (FHA) protein
MSKLYVLNGPQIGEFYELRGGVSFIGRALDNDIRIEDRTVSRKHLRIAKREDKYLITDLKSRNGTFFRGKFLIPGTEVEVTEGAPIAIGISVICLGEECAGQMMPFLDSGEPAMDTNELNETLVEHRDRVTLKKLKFLDRVSNTLMETLSIKKVLERILEHTFDLLKRIDRGAFVLIDPDTEETTDIVYKSKKPSDDETTVFCQDVVEEVIRTGKPFAVSNTKTQDSKFADTLEVLKIESVLCVPLIYHSEILGAIYVDSLERPSGFRRNDLALLMNISQRIASSIEDARFASDILEAAEALSPDDR